VGGLDPAKILIVLLLAVIIIGPDKLPKAARQVGTLWRQLNEMRARLEREVRDAIPDIEIPKIPVMPKRGITGYITGMMTGAGTTTSAPEAEMEATARAGIDPALDGSSRPGFEPAPDMRRDRTAQGTVAWQSSATAAAGEHSELPAGWHAVGSPGPGYASGSSLSPVPSMVAAGPISAEATLTFDEPSWN
jgi:Sec-independent protein translocase protein TatA